RHERRAGLDPTNKVQDVAQAHAAPSRGTDQVASERRQLALVDQVANALQRLAHFYRGQLAQRDVVQLERALDLTVHDQPPVVGVNRRIATSVLGHDVEVVVRSDQVR